VDVGAERLVLIVGEGLASLSGADQRDTAVPR
jgi:hypothetical protein